MSRRGPVGSPDDDLTRLLSRPPAATSPLARALAGLARQHAAHEALRDAAAALAQVSLLARPTDPRDVVRGVAAAAIAAAERCADEARRRVVLAPDDATTAAELAACERVAEAVRRAVAG